VERKSKQALAHLLLPYTIYTINFWLGWINLDFRLWSSKHFKQYLFLNNLVISKLNLLYYIDKNK